jgi:hypothetical protein
MNHIRQTIYTLKRQYGVKAELYSITDIQSNLETGEKTLQKIVYKINKAVFLPRKIFSELIALIGGQRLGNRVDKQTRFLLIDGKDLPKEYELRQKDYVLIQHQRYNISDIKIFDNNLGYVLTITKITGESPRAIIEESSKDRINISQEAANG